MNETIKIPESVKRSETPALPIAGVGHCALSEAFNMKCVEGLLLYPDNYFDLAIVDPPYGIGASKPTDKPNRVKQKNGQWLTTPKNYYEHKGWDDMAFSYEQFLEILRVSKEQIIWGCNFFDFQLKGGRIVWDKMNGLSDQHDVEIAYCSIGYRTDIVRYMWRGMMQGLSASKEIKKANVQQGNKALNEKRIHPTQKPVKLYDWLLDNYANEGWKIVDPFLGSGSSRIAANKAGLDFTGFELDEEYFKAQEKRWQNWVSQMRLF